MQEMQEAVLSQELLYLKKMREAMKKELNFIKKLAIWGLGLLATALKAFICMEHLD